jgi:hypothetical protein
MSVLHILWYIFIVMTGISSQQTRYYAFWSGIGSKVDLLVIGLLYYFHHNCHKPACPRIGHPDDTGVVYCKKHNPNHSVIK